ncbi:MAG: hypothetical protein JNK60_19690 [Acidobacteria bacterium]|nr:hypothetical protein [Acidobacteriota bacterium]
MKPYTAAALIFLATAPAVALAADPVSKKDGLAVSGYDTVAYFTEGRPAAGKPELETEWRGAKWRFSTAANRDAFQAAPEKYAPQYGGYCAWAVSRDYTYSADPLAWKIVDGKLYLNYNKDVQKKWAAELPTIIQKADGNWPAVLAKPSK